MIFPWDERHFSWDQRLFEFSHVYELSIGDLNSLTHQDFVPRSLSLLDAAGRFVELAKLQAWSAAQVAAFRADVKYAVLLLDRRVAEAPSTLRNEMRSVATVASEMMSYGRR